jgi:hypothetical protein
MARSRNIKPGFFLNDTLGSLPPLARLMFAGIWTICDREGRIMDRPSRIKAEVLPYDNADADSLLAMLHESGFIDRYEAEGMRLIQVCAWDKHQNPHVKEQPSTLPCRCQHQTSTRQAPGINGHDTVQAEKLPALAGLIPSSLIPSSLIPDSLSKQVAASPPPARSPAASSPVQFSGLNAETIDSKAVVRLSADFDLPAEWGKDAMSLGWSRGGILRESERFRQYYVVGKGAGSKRGVKGWRQAWSNWLVQSERINGVAK